MYKRISNIANTYQGYGKLIGFFHSLPDVYFENIEVEFQGWFAANMGVARGCVLDRLSQNVNSIQVSASQKTTAQILLKKNEFLTYYGHINEIDHYHTIIGFQKLTAEGGKSFTEYVMGGLLQRAELPGRSAGVKEARTLGIY